MSNQSKNFDVQTDTNGEKVYSIPVKWRRIENLHIVFWLFKDLSWCMVWKPLAIAMIFPTLFLAGLITIRTRQYVSEVCHNLAIFFWIMANAYWMISEFFLFDGLALWGNFSYKFLAIIPFSLGFLVLAYYYIYWKPKNKEMLETM